MNPALWLIFGGLVILVGFMWWHGWRRARRRAALRSQRLSEADRATLARVFPLWERVPPTIQDKVEGLIHVFCDEKVFVACGGLGEITREMKLAVAGPACLLIAHRTRDDYRGLRSVLIYPDAYRVRDEWGDEDVRLGESWSSGSVVLSWQSVRQGSANEEDGLNVVMHEFAHQLDQDDGAADGVPNLDDSEDYGLWSQAFAPAYESFCERVEAGKRTVLDDYGAHNPAEFFAVATETFFERPRAMKREEPEVYAQLMRFYQMDPETW